MKTSPDKKKIWLHLSSIVLSLVALGFLRDSIFKTINALLRAWDLEEDYFLPPFLGFLENFEYDTLVNLKWVLTVLFSMLYLGISVWAVKVLFKEKRHFLRITVYTYGAILAVSALFFIIGILVPKLAGTMYEFARYLMGMAQSPLILMLLIPAFKLSEKEINKTKDI